MWVNQTCPQCYKEVHLIRMAVFDTDSSENEDEKEELKSHSEDIWRPHRLFSDLDYN
jgi:hypothetical protein